jgi:uncharacterized repeat protein (TIGR01451 family)
MTPPLLFVTTLLTTSLFAEIAPPPPITIYSGVVLDSYCGLANGAISVNVTGGTQPYTYVWSPEPAVGQGTAQITGLGAGTWTVTVTDGMALQATSNFVIQGIPDLLGWAFQTPAQDGHANCPGSCAGEFRVPVSYLPGTPPYSYSEPVQGYDTFGEPFFYVPGGACGGDEYQITVTDATGCSGVMNIVIAGAQIGQPPMAVTNITGACSGSGGQGGSVTVTNVYDGQFWEAPTLTIDLNGQGQMQPIVTGNTITIGLLNPGTYTLVRQWTYTSYPCWEQLVFTIPDLGVACGSVSGQVFIDTDDDCLRSPLEVPVPEMVLTVQPGPQYAITGSDGQYSIDLGDGSYTIEQNSSSLIQLCPGTTPTPFTLASDAQIISFADSSTTQLDLMAQAGSGAARPGFPFSYTIRARNLSPQLSGALTFTMTFDPQLVFDNASIVPNSVAGNILTWELPEINAFGAQQINVQFTVPAATPLGTVLSGTFNVASDLNDVALGNNTVDLSHVVVGSYDPNNKIATTSTRASEELYFINEDEWIDYTIHFQNTGTDTAINVTITDTLPATLDMGTFQQSVASHPFTVSFKPDRIISWQLDNIMLPDSATDEAGSQGLVKFRIRPQQPLVSGTAIENIANIYFDFNEPVITEPSVLTADFSTGIEESDATSITITPNPADERIAIRSTEPLGQVEIWGTDGRLLLTHAMNGTFLQIAVGTFAPGMYVVRSVTATGKLHRQRFIKL